MTPKRQTVKRSLQMCGRCTRSGHEADLLIAPPNGPQEPESPAFPLVIGLAEPPAGIEPATPS
jgi:hypothetical protein